MKGWFLFHNLFDFPVTSLSHVHILFYYQVAGQSHDNILSNVRSQAGPLRAFYSISNTLNKVPKPLNFGEPPLTWSGHVKLNPTYRRNSLYERNEPTHTEH